MISIPQYLYRIRGCKVTFALLAVLLAVNFAAAQRPQMRHREETTDQQPAAKKPTAGNARAIGVVEFLPKGGVRLIPVALWLDGRYYDASLYAANPEPFALQPETVYQAEDYGEPTGLFTVTEPKEINGSWVADGQWKPHLNMDVKLASDAAKEAAKLPPKKPSKAVMTGDADDGPPVLHRPASSGTADPPSAPSTPPSTANKTAPSNGTSTSSQGTQTGDASNTTASSSSGRPTLKRPGDDPDPAPASAPATSPTSTTRDDDPDRPTLKTSSPAPAQASTSSSAGAQTAAPAVNTSSPSSDENDPNRPLLQRGKQANLGDSQTPATSNAAAGAKRKQSAMATTPPSSTPAGPTQMRKSYPAISDAGTYETRPLLYSLSGADRDHATQELQKLALEELRHYATKRKITLPKGTGFTDYDLRAFDLDLSNSATLVFTGKLAAQDRKTLHGGEFDYFVTVVAHQDINGDLQKVFASVTDSNYLDAVSRMELVGAVDASGNGHGDLLFRQYSDTGINYGLYRVYPYQMQKLFEGGASM